MDKFSSIIEFSKLKKECVFCKARMSVVLTNFIGLTKNGIPLIRSPLVDSKFNFCIEHTTPNFSINADVAVDADKNEILFSKFTNGELPAIDEHLVKQIFEDFRPYIELFCSNKQCSLKYHLWGSCFKLKKIPQIIGAWVIEPFHFVLEAAVIKKYVVHNHWNTNSSFIYSRVNTESRPIETTMIDFSTMDKDRLTNRVQTIVTFS